MVDPALAADSRRRAAELRRLAAVLERSPLDEVRALADAETWFGPTAAAFAEDLRRALRLRDEAVDGLRRAAAHADEVAGAGPLPAILPR